MSTATTPRRREGRPRSTEDLRPCCLLIGARQRRVIEARADADGTSVSEALRRTIDEHPAAEELAGA